jgi:hypothetical protein
VTFTASARMFRPVTSLSRDSLPNAICFAISL